MLSLLCIIASAALTVLFPAVNISKPKGGKYNVGVIDLYLPVQFDQKDKNGKKDGYVSARLMYPTNEKIGWNERTNYFPSDLADIFCEELIKIGAPPPLNKHKWMLKTWKFSTFAAKTNAMPLKHLGDGESKNEKKDGKEGDDNKSNNTTVQKLPLAVFSHGLTGSAEIYTYQCMNMASTGTVVLALTHSDGSAPVMKKQDGTILKFDKSVGKLDYASGEQDRARRQQCDHRAMEFLAATSALLDLNNANIPELEQWGISFVDKLDVKDVTAAGHSFGAATAVAAAARSPSMFSSCVAHDPAISWIPDDSRGMLFRRGDDDDEDKKKQWQHDESNPPSNVCDEEKKEPSNADSDSCKNANSLHDLDLLFLYSHQWRKVGWGAINEIHNMFKTGKLGAETRWNDDAPLSSTSLRPLSSSDVAFVYKAHHSEFSDSCMMMPLWLGRTTGMTGLRNPHDTAEEIGERTLHFLRDTRNKREKMAMMKEKME